MIEQQLIVKRKTGLQARPAALFVQEANRFQSEVYIVNNERKVNAKSIMGLMSLAISPNTEITLIVDGHDEEEAMEVLRHLIETEE